VWAVAPARTPSSSRHARALPARLTSGSSCASRAARGCGRSPPAACAARASTTARARSS
jgi:hypothetical protein